MRIIELYVANFGILSDLRLEFGKGLNSFNRGNGEGKSTLCEFITAMFYGLDSVRANEKSLNPRTRFLPFKGGSYGGSLTFEDNGNIFRIERFFDNAKKQSDSLKVFENGEEKKNPEEPGYSIFGVGSDTFRRLIYMSSFNMIPEGSSEISAKIGNFAGAEELTSKNAGAEIEKAMSELVPKKQVRGGKSVVPNLKEELDSLTMRKRQLENEKNSLPGKYSRRAEIISEAVNCRGALDKLNRRRIDAERWAQYERGAEALAGKQNKLREIAGKYPSGIPSPGDIKDLRDAAENVKVNKNLIGIIGFGPFENERLEQITACCNAAKKGKYGDESPFGVDFGAVERDLGTLREIGASISALEERKNKILGSKEQVSLKGTFERREREAEDLCRDIKDYIDQVERSKDLLREETRKAEEIREKNRRIASVTALSGGILLAIGLCGLIVGAVLLALAVGGSVLPIVLTAAGALAALGGIGLLIGSGIAHNRSKTGPASRETAKRIEDVEDKLSIRLGSFGSVYEGVNGQLAFTGDFENYLNNLRTGAAIDEEIGSFTEAKASAEKDILELLDIFRIETRPAAAGAGALRDLKNEFDGLREKKRAVDNARSKIQSSMAVVSAFISGFTAGGVSEGELVENPETVLLDFRKAAELEEEMAAEVERLKDLKADLGCDEKPVLPEPGEEERLVEKLNDLNNQFRETEVSIRQSEEIVGDTAYCESRIGELQDKIKEAMIFYSELEFAGKLIAKAEKNLKEKYIGPVSERFEEYKKEFPDSIDPGVVLRPDFTVEFEKNGAIRSQSHLSTGQLACIALCEKTALAESILGEENCFFVLDDPFNGLDNRNLETVKKLLEKLGEKKQIIYLTCSDERSF